MNDKVISFLQQQEKQIVNDWQSRLGMAADLAATQLEPQSRLPVRTIFHEMLRLLQIPAAASNQPAPSFPLVELKPLPDWRINLCQAIEVILTGQVVVGHWTRTHLDATDGELLDLSDQLDRVFHQLIRAYTQRYCSQCRANDKVRDES